MQKFVNLVDLVKSFPTTIYLQRFVSIQPRTSLSKFAKNSPKKTFEVSKKNVRKNISISFAGNFRATGSLVLRLQETDSKSAGKDLLASKD